MYQSQKNLVTISTVVVIILLVALFFVLLPNVPEQDQPQALPNVRYIEFKIYDPVYVGVANGFYWDEGINVEFAAGTLAGPTAIQAVASGYAEAGLSSIPAIINANAAGLPILGVADLQSALPGQPLEKYYVRKADQLAGIPDLKGKNFAVNLWKSSFHYTALMGLSQNDMQPEDVNFVLLPFDQQPEALINGSVDVIGLMAPYSSYLEKTYPDDIEILFDAHDVFGDKQFSHIFVNRLWAAEHPDQAAAFVAGTVRAINWIEDHQTEAARIISRYTGIEAELIDDYHFQKNGIVVTEDVRFWFDYMLQSGDITADWLNLEDVASNKYQP